MVLLVKELSIANCIVPISFFKHFKDLKSCHGQFWGGKGNFIQTFVFIFSSFRKCDMLDIKLNKKGCSLLSNLHNNLTMSKHLYFSSSVLIWKNLYSQYQYFFHHHHHYYVCHRHGFPWPSSSTCPFYPLFSAGFPCYILYQYRAVVDSFLLVTILLLVRVKEFTGVHCLLASPYFSCSVLHVLFI